MRVLKRMGSFLLFILLMAGLPLYRLLVGSFVLTCDEKYMPVRPADVFLYIYACGLIVISDAAIAVLFCIHFRSVFWGIGAGVVSFYPIYIAWFFVARRLLNAALKKALKKT